MARTVLYRRQWIAALALELALFSGLIGHSAEAANWSTRTEPQPKPTATPGKFDDGSGVEANWST